MKTTLRAPVELVAISVFAEVAVWERRPELQRLMRAAEAAGRIDAATVAAALPGLSDSACGNLLRTLEHARLTEANGAIGPFGKQCAQTGTAPAWELGTYTFLVARHPCFGTMLIGFRRERADWRDQNFQSLVAQPAWLSASPQRVWTSAFEDKTRFTLAALPTAPGQSALCRVETLPAAQLHWDLELLSGKNTLRVEGSAPTPEGPKTFRSAEFTVPTAEVQALFPSWEPRWSAPAGRLLMAYDRAADRDGQDSFLRTLSYKNLTAGKRGSFETARVEDIPVGPSNAADARAWATALCLARAAEADAYVSPPAWEQGWEATLANTPLEAEAGDAPALAPLLDPRVGLHPRLRWLLSTASDLSME